MIRARQHIPLCMSGDIYLREVHVLESGESEIRLVNQVDSSLPTKDKTRLGDVLKAGVPLNQVPSKVLGTQNVTLSLDKKEQNTQTENGDK